MKIRKDGRGLYVVIGERTYRPPPGEYFVVDGEGEQWKRGTKWKEGDEVRITQPHGKKNKPLKTVHLVYLKKGKERMSYYRLEIWED